jgi:hypothetical protein
MQVEDRLARDSADVDADVIAVGGSSGFDRGAGDVGSAQKTIRYLLKGCGMRAALAC